MKDLLTYTPYGKRVVDVEQLIDLFQAPEGTINLYYGRIGQGKTYNATADVIEDLKNGRQVYVNWKINLDEFSFDDQQRFGISFWNFVLGRKRYYEFLKTNLHYKDMDDADFLEVLNSSTDCVWYLDEGQDIFDSYRGTSIPLSTRKLIHRTRHYNRTLNIIAQRPTAVAVAARGNVNRFYRCSKMMEWPFLIFRREEFQDMVGETVSENPESLVSRKLYFAKKAILRAYNSYYLRGGFEFSTELHFLARDLSFKERALVLAKNFLWLFGRPLLRAAPSESSSAEASPEDAPRVFERKTVRVLEFPRKEGLRPISEVLEGIRKYDPFRRKPDSDTRLT